MINPGFLRAAIVQVRANAQVLLNVSDSLDDDCVRLHAWRE